MVETFGITFCVAQFHLSKIHFSRYFLISRHCHHLTFYKHQLPLYAIFARTFSRRVCVCVCAPYIVSVCGPSTILHSFRWSYMPNEACIYTVYEQIQADAKFPIISLYAKANIMITIIVYPLAVVIFSYLHCICHSLAKIHSTYFGQK